MSRSRRACGACVMVVVLARAATACDNTPPDIFANLEGNDVRLTWTGTLTPTEQWVVLQGVGYPVDIPVMTPVGNTAANELVLDDLGADADGYAWAVRCEGSLAAGPLSDLAFKLVRDVSVIAPPGYPREFRNIYLMSMPGRLGLPDIADTSDATPCAPASGRGDGIVNADDLLCAWFTPERGSMTLYRWDLDLGVEQSRAILYEDFALEGTPGVVLAGEWTAPLVAGEGYVLVSCASQADRTYVPHVAVIVGAHDPVAPCQEVRLAVPGADSASPILNIPYHGTYQSSVELLCGLRGRDWQDNDGDGFPDTCPNGIFDGSTEVAVHTFDNSPDWSPTDNSWSSAGVLADPRTGLPVFLGAQFDVLPGEAYLAGLRADQQDRTPCVPTAR